MAGCMVTAVAPTTSEERLDARRNPVAASTLCRTRRLMRRSGWHQSLLPVYIRRARWEGRLRDDHEVQRALYLLALISAALYQDERAFDFFNMSRPPCVSGLFSLLFCHHPAQLQRFRRVPRGPGRPEPRTRRASPPCPPRPLVPVLRSRLKTGLRIVAAVSRRVPTMV